MRYLLMVSGPAVAAAPTTAPENGNEAGPVSRSWETQLAERGIPLRRMPLYPAEAAVTVRVRDGETLVTDGPYAGAEEQVAAVERVECADLDEAILIAGSHPDAGPGTPGAVEIRPFWEG